MRRAEQRHIVIAGNIGVGKSTLVSLLAARIARRARPAERAIQAGYLASLERHYEAWIGEWEASPVLMVETDQLDLLEREDDLGQLAGRIYRSLAAGEGVSTGTIR